MHERSMVLVEIAQEFRALRVMELLGLLLTLLLLSMGEAGY